MPNMKNQMPDTKLAAPKRVSPELAEFLHMLKSLESHDKTVDASRAMR
jgi:hypothetical protein